MNSEMGVTVLQANSARQFETSNVEAISAPTFHSVRKISTAAGTQAPVCTSHSGAFFLFSILWSIQRNSTNKTESLRRTDEDTLMHISVPC